MPRSTSSCENGSEPIVRENRMALAEMMLTVLEESGLLALWQAVSPWLALDERQLIFVIATPVFLAVTAIEYLKLRHNPQLMDTREAIRNFTRAGYQTTEPTVCRYYCLSGLRAVLPLPPFSARAELADRVPYLSGRRLLLLLDAPCQPSHALVLGCPCRASFL